MQKFNPTTFYLLSLLLGASPVFATDHPINSPSTTALTLLNGDTLEVNAPNGSLTQSGSVDVTLDGTSTTHNSGTISNTGSKRDFIDGAGGSTFTITNSGTLQTANADVIQLGSSSAYGNNNVTLTNSGTMNSMNSSAGGAQAVDFNGITTGTNKVYNLTGGIMEASQADAVRPGVNGIVENDGQIKATAPNGSSDDGVDAQSNSGVSISNAVGINNETIGVATIEGARHGITGGNTTSGSGVGGYGGTGAYTMTIYNGTGGTIEGDDGSGINIDGFGVQGPGTTLVTNESVSVTNHGTISGYGQTGDGDGIDVDGVVTVDNFGKIVSGNAVSGTVGTIEFSEGITVGGGMITNEANATIEGSVASGNAEGVGRGITLAGIDKDGSTNGFAMPLESIYENSMILNSGLIKGDSESGIAVLGTTGGGYTVTIDNYATGTIEGANTGVSEDKNIPASTSGPANPYAGKSSGQSLNQGAIELDDKGNSYVINDYGAITQDTTSTGTAVEMHGVSNQLNLYGSSAVVTGDVSGDTASDSTMTINPGAGQTITYAYKIENFSVQVNSDGANGTVILTGNSPYTGPTTVNAGNLDIRGSIAQSATTVKNSGLLDGTGSVGGVTVQSGGKLAGGDSTTTLGATQALSTKFQLSLNSLTLDGGSTLVFDLYHATPTIGTELAPSGGTLLNIATAFSAGANVTTGSIFLDLSGTSRGGQLGDPNVYELALFETGDTTLTTSDFTLENLNPSLAPSDYNLVFVDQHDGQTALDLEVAPEPTTWALMLGGLGLFLAFRPSRRKSSV